MNAYILQLAEKDSAPLVPGAALVAAEVDGHFTAYADEQRAPRGAATRHCRPAIAFLWRAKAGLYAVACEPAELAKIDPENKSQTVADFELSPAAGAWPCKTDAGAVAITSTTAELDPRKAKPAPLS